MPYGKSNNSNNNINVNEVKKKMSEQMPGVDVGNLSTTDMKNLLLNQINNNKSLNIDESVKEKINKGDIAGLKNDIIDYLSKNKSNNGVNERLIQMLQKNDMEGLKGELLGLLMGNMNTQKKNEIVEDVQNTEEVHAVQEVHDANEESGIDGGDPVVEDSPLDFGGIGNLPLMSMLMSQVFTVNKNDERVILLNAIKPFLSDSRQTGIDACIKIMGMVGFFEKMVNKVGG